MRIKNSLKRILVFCLCTALFQNAYGKHSREEEEKECGEDERVLIKSIYERNQDKVTSQGKLGICYAHTGAQILESLYDSIYDEHVEISPLFLSIHLLIKGYKSKKIKKRRLEGKTIVEQVRGGLYEKSLKGTSSMLPIPKEYVEGYLKQVTFTESTKEGLIAIEDFLRDYEGFFKDKKNSKKPFPFEQYCENNRLQKETVQFFYDYLKKHGLRKRNLSFVNSYKKTLYHFFQTYSQAQRKLKKLKHLPPFKIKVYSKVTHTTNHLIKKLEKNFNQKHIYPVGIGYNAKSVYGEDDGKRIWATHSSMIIGKVCHNNKRKWIIRNSHGGSSIASGISLTAQRDDNKTHQDAKGDHMVSNEKIKEILGRNGSFEILKFKRKSL